MITDEELLLYYYRDGLDALDRVRIGAALAEQPELAQRLHRLVARLDAAASAPEVPVPEHIQQRWHAALDRAAAQGNASQTASAGRRPFAGFRWQAVAAAVAVLAIVATIQVTRQSTPNQTTEVAATTTPGAASSPGAAGPDAANPDAARAGAATAYERGLKWHLASTEEQLTRFGRAAPDERARLIATIVEQNRLYALAAERAGEPQLARVLRAFAPVLESLGRAPGEPSASSLARLTFELRVIQARLSAEAAKSSSAQPVAL